jgi:hypothetical protein
MSLLHPRVIAELELAKYGYEVLPCADMFGPLPGNDYLVFSDDVAKTQREFARFSKNDASTSISPHGSSEPRSRQRLPIMRTSGHLHGQSPGSTYVILHHLIGEHAGGGWGFIRGPRRRG